MPAAQVAAFRMRWLLLVAVAARLLVNSEAAQQQFGESCEIKSAEFTNDYLYMSAGWVNQNPILWSVRPQLASRRKKHGKWRVEQTTVKGKPFFRVWNHGAEAYLVAKGSDPVAKKTASGTDDKELLWKIEGQGASDGLTIQQNGQFLTARGDKSGDERAVLMGTRSNKSTAKWTITC